MKIFKFLDSVLIGMKDVFLRFSVPAVLAMGGATIGILFIHDIEYDALNNILWTIFLGFPLFISARLIAEKLKWKTKRYALLLGGCVLFLLGYYFLLPENIMESLGSYAFRSILWGISFVLMITFIPFLEKKDSDTPRFWNFNKKLFLNFLQAGFFAVTIFLGISAAFWAVDELFNLSINGDRYMELWMVCAGVVAPFLFLHNVPANPQENLRKEYSRALLIFTQYILLPLVVLYFVILYSYTVKVAITWEWPMGILSYMIAAFSFVGIVLHFFIYPRLKEVKWLEKFIKIFYIILLPQIAMFFMSIWMRVNQYGITEKRYLVMVGGLWLLGMALYFLFSRKRDLRVISISLFGIIFLSSFGPWGAFSVSEWSQVNRLEELLVKNNILVDGHVEKATKDLAREDATEISAIFRYLYRHHDFDSVQPWFEIDLVTVNPDEGDHYGTVEKVVRLLDVEYVSAWEVSDREGKYFSFYHENEKGFEIGGFDYLVPVSSYSWKENNELVVGDKKYKFYFEFSENEFVIREGENVQVVDLTNYFDELLKDSDGNNFEEGREVFEGETELMRIKIRFGNISGNVNRNDGSYEVDSVNGQVFVKMKNSK